MGVPVALAVAELCRPPVVGVAQVGGDVGPGALPGVGPGPAQGRRDPVRLGRARQVHDGLGQVELGLGQPHELHRPGRGVGHHQGQGIGQADVLAGQDDQAPGDEPGVLAALEHAGQPVQRRRRGPSPGST